MVVNYSSNDEGSSLPVFLWNEQKMNSKIKPIVSMPDEGRYKELVTSQAIHIMFGIFPALL